jgi:hypothetical protein
MNRKLVYKHSSYNLYSQKKPQHYIVIETKKKNILSFIIYNLFKRIFIHSMSELINYYKFVVWALKIGK